MLLQGLLKKGDHIITTSMEHNAVMRPLHALSKAGVSYDAVPCDSSGSLIADDIIPYIKKETKAVVMLHASNVCGTVMPIETVAEICKKHKIRLIVDAAQTAGVLDINAGDIDALAFTGHKGLLSSQGIGGFIIKKDFAEEIKPLIFGGTGSLSHEMEQPRFLPDKFESGTMNIPAILGLKKAIEYISFTGIKSIYDKEMALASAFISKVHDIDGVRLTGKNASAGRVAVVSLDFPHNDNALIAASLDENYGIMTRCGLHCAPFAHKTLNTYPHGTVRFSFGYFNTLDEIEFIAQSIKEIIKKGTGYGLSAY
jgi:cysteine desulfurase family protein